MWGELLLSLGWWPHLTCPLCITTSFLPVVHKMSEQTVEEFSSRVQKAIARSLGISTSQLTAEDVSKWLSCQFVCVCVVSLYWWSSWYCSSYFTPSTTASPTAATPDPTQSSGGGRISAVAWGEGHTGGSGAQSHCCIAPGPTHRHQSWPQWDSSRQCANFNIEITFI